jgi:hypothetical protein
MRRILASLVILACSAGLSAQEFSFGISFSGTAAKQFQKPLGIFGSYTYSINQDLDLHVNLQIANSFLLYDQITFNSSTGSGYLVNKVRPQNYWMALSAHLNFMVFDRGCLEISAGPQLSVNYFFANELIQDIPTDTQEDRTYHRKIKYLNRPGFGANLEFELTGLSRKKMSFFTSLTPQIILFGPAGVRPSDVQGAIVGNTTRVGIRYQI